MLQAIHAPCCSRSGPDLSKETTDRREPQHSSAADRRALPPDESGTRFVGIAEWPDRKTWQAAFDAKMVYDEPETRQAFVDAIAEAADEPLLLLEVTDDLLERAP